MCSFDGYAGESMDNIWFQPKLGITIMNVALKQDNIKNMLLSI